MRFRQFFRAALLLPLLLGLLAGKPANADGNLKKVKHVVVIMQTEQINNGIENPADDQTMSFYTEDDIPFYYSLASKFAINDRYFASVLGPTFPNRSYLLAATSFGHLTTSDTFAPPGATSPSPARFWTCWRKTT